MKPVSGFCCLVIGAVTLGACSSTPSYPPPSPDSSQILVQLEGKPKDGVSGPKMREVEQEYSRSRESVEKGRAFERVNYDEIQDVVVIADNGKGTRRPPPIVLPSAPEIVIDEDGFSRSQYLVVLEPAGKGRFEATLSARHSLDHELHLSGLNESDNSFEVSISRGSLATFTVNEPGRYEVYCDENESFHCVVFVSSGPFAWIGPSDQDAFFDLLPPGSYEVTVYAPRLPAWKRRVTVAAGKRETVTADLTVNDLPKVGE